jgi:hypothetical protein
MLKCDKCHKRMFLDRQYTKADHLETFCLTCGSRKFFHPPTDSNEGQWLLKKEALRAKVTITPL